MPTACGGHGEQYTSFKIGVRWQERVEINSGVVKVMRKIGQKHISLGQLKTYSHKTIKKKQFLTKELKSIFSKSMGLISGTIFNDLS